MDRIVNGEIIHVHEDTPDWKCGNIINMKEA